MDSQLLHQCARLATQDERPQPKYQIDQQTKDGIICGYYWVSIGTAFQDHTYSGWWYVIEKNLQQQYYLEADVTAIGPAPSERPKQSPSLLAQLEAEIRAEKAEDDLDTAIDVLAILERNVDFSFLLDCLVGFVRGNEFGKPTSRKLQVLELAVDVVQN